MIVRPALLPDLNACILLDHDTVTDHVWQMLVREESTQVNMTFQTVRLPRDMPAAYPRNLDQLLDHWQQGDGFLVAEVDGEVRGYVDLVAEPWQTLATDWQSLRAKGNGRYEAAGGSASVRLRSY